MKKVELYTFLRGLETSSFQHPRVTYAVNKNKRLLNEEIETMEEFIKPSEQYIKFSEENEELAKKFAKKDETGNPKISVTPVPGDPRRVQKSYDIEGVRDINSKYRKELAKLEKKYEKAISEQNDKIAKYNKEFLLDESEFQPFMIDLEILVDHEKCPQQVMDLIYFMIKES